MQHKAEHQVQPVHVDVLLVVGEGLGVKPVLQQPRLGVLVSAHALRELSGHPSLLLDLLLVFPVLGLVQSLQQAATEGLLATDSAAGRSLGLHPATKSSAGRHGSGADTSQGKLRAGYSPRAYGSYESIRCDFN